jgi:hypothetical protein
VSSTTVTPAAPPTYPHRGIPGQQSETDEEEMPRRLQYNATSAVKHLFWDENANKDVKDNDILRNARVDEESGEVESMLTRTSLSQKVKDHTVYSCKHKDNVEYSSLVHNTNSFVDSREVKCQKHCCSDQETKLTGQKQCCSSQQQTEVKGQNECSASTEHTGLTAGPSHGDTKEQKLNNKTTEMEVTGGKSRRRRKRTKSGEWLQNT